MNQPAAMLSAKMPRPDETEATGMHPAQIAAIRRMTLSERFGVGMRLLRSARALLAAGVRQRHPEWSGEQVETETHRLMANGRH